ncbi:hypothetical protein CXB51_029514 [Gossypium anomalum]|uniref:Uncharacterized protein n=1 Tax=Gossypium anomalum TaxID=47600 RepID=A0A8J5Z1G3_9ROSI|nr:hypothetical protein CXB51_029514 [Gossypium anomalum]
MCMANISFPEDKYGEISDLSQHERVPPATNPDFEERDISGENPLMVRAGKKRGLPGAEEQVRKKQNLSQHQPKSKSKKLSLEELIEKKSVSEIRKIFEDRINRLIKNVRKDMKIDMVLVLGEQWPVRPDLQGIKEKFRAIAKANLAIEEAKKRLLAAGREFETLENQRKTPSTTAENYDLHMDNIKETLKKQLSSGPITVDQDFDLDNCFDFQSLPDIDFDKSFRPPDNLRSAFTDLENQLYEKGNNQDRGKVTEVGHIAAQVLVCAAVKEMEEFSLGKLDMEMLKKWATTLNKAKELGFQVGFADDLLRKNLYAYFAYRTMLDEAKEKERKPSDFVLNCHDQIESHERPVRSDVRDIMKKYQEIKSEHEDEKLTEDKAKWILLELVEKLKKLEQRSKRYINV